MHHTGAEMLDIDIRICIYCCWAVFCEVSWEPWYWHFVVVALVRDEIYLLLGYDVGMLEGGTLGERFKGYRLDQLIILVAG